MVRSAVRGEGRGAGFRGAGPDDHWWPLRAKQPGCHHFLFHTQSPSPGLMVPRHPRHRPNVEAFQNLMVLLAVGFTLLYSSSCGCDTHLVTRLFPEPKLDSHPAPHVSAESRTLRFTGRSRVNPLDGRPWLRHDAPDLLFPSPP